jgi:hypothetical protein
MLRGLKSKVVLFSPGFSPVLGVRDQQKTVSTVFGGFPAETVETVSQTYGVAHTGLKPGVNEKDF